MLTEWYAAAVEPGGGKPTAADWQAVEVPGRPAAFAGAECVAYRTTFPDPRDPGDALARLTLRGAYAHARVWLNDALVVESDTYVEPIRVPFEPASENELVVECRAPEDRFGGIHDTDDVPAADAVPGIWWDADLTTHPESFVVGARARPRLTDDGAAVDTRLDVYTATGVDDRITLTTRPTGQSRGRGMMDRAAVEAGPGERTTVEYTVDLHDPSLWWPRGAGPQHRYEVRAKLDGDVATTTTGIATVEWTDDGLVVNGQRVPVRGVAVEDGAVADVERAVDLNANLLRARAHALSPAVYDSCDEAGLLVWQDLPLTGTGLFDIQRGREVAAATARERGGRPSLVAVTVHDEPTATFADRLGSGFLDRLRLRWRAWRAEYDHGAAEEVAGAVPDDVPVFTVVGEPGSDPDAAALYPGWNYGSAADLPWLLDRYPDLGETVAAVGAGSLADDDPEDLAGFDRAKHDAVVPGESTADSQAYQARLLRSVLSRLRVGGGAAIVVRSLRDTGDAGMGVHGRDGEAKTGAEAVAAAFEPVQALLADPTPGDSDLVVVNDTPDAVEAQVGWRIGDTAEQTTVAVDAADRTTVETLSLPDAGGVELELVVDGEAVRNRYDL